MAKLEAQSTRARNAMTNSRVLVIFVLICLTSLRIAIWTASTIILWLVYGRERVARELVHIAKFKPELASNGEVLWHRTFELFLIGQLIWISLSVAVLLLVWKLLPRPDRDATQQCAYSSWGLLAVIFLFFTAMLVPLKFILLITPLAIAALLISAWTSARMAQQP